MKLETCHAHAESRRQSGRDQDMAIWQRQVMTQSGTRQKLHPNTDFIKRSAFVFHVWSWKKAFDELCSDWWSRELNKSRSIVSDWIFDMNSWYSVMSHYGSRHSSGRVSGSVVCGIRVIRWVVCIRSIPMLILLSMIITFVILMSLTIRITTGTFTTSYTSI